MSSEMILNTFKHKNCLKNTFNYSTVVQHPPRHPKGKGSTLRERKLKKTYLLHLQAS